MISGRRYSSINKNSLRLKQTYITIVRRGYNILKLLSGEDVDGDKVTLSVTVLSSLGSGHLYNLIDRNTNTQTKSNTVTLSIVREQKNKIKNQDKSPPGAIPNQPSYNTSLTLR